MSRIYQTIVNQEGLDDRIYDSVVKIFEKSRSRIFQCLRIQRSIFGRFIKDKLDVVCLQLLPVTSSLKLHLYFPRNRS